MCERHRELFEVYQKEVARYTATVEALKAVMFSEDKQDVQRHHGYVEQARIKSEQARLNLQQHIAEHGCDYVNTAALPGK
jgi:hypothetical protein